jgi:small-conductance mechanosensitive channel
MNREKPEIVDPNLHPYLKPEALPVQVYHVAVRGLVGITFISVIGIIVLSIYDKTSEGLISIASACIGGLVGIFAQRAASH